MPYTSVMGIQEFWQAVGSSPSHMMFLNEMAAPWIKHMSLASGVIMYVLQSNHEADGHYQYHSFLIRCAHICHDHNPWP